MQRRLVGVLGERGQELAPRIDIEPVAQHIARAYERDARRRIARQRSGHEAIERFAYASRRARGQDLELDLLPRLPRRFELPRVANPGLEGGDRGRISDRLAGEIPLFPEKALGSEHANLVAERVRAGPFEGDGTRQELGGARLELDDAGRPDTPNRRRAQRDVEPDHHRPRPRDATEDAREVVARQGLAPAEGVERRVVDGHDDEAGRLAWALEIDEEVEGTRLERLEIAHGGGPGDRARGQQPHHPQLQQPRPPLPPPPREPHQNPPRRALYGRKSRAR